MSSLSRREFLTHGLLTGAYVLLGSACSRKGEPVAADKSRRHMNVLFIAIDDLRPQLGCYGIPYMHTPNIDALVGRVIGELDRLGMRENTVICLWGDHGWHLGENSVWGKMTNFEQAAHSPLIISAPRQGRKGGRTRALSEFVDIYPTLCELSGLPVPGGLEGISLAPLMDDPKRPWKKAAFSQDNSRRNDIMGRTMRTDRYRYTEWMSVENELVGRELYDHENDPDENVNLAARPGHEELMERLRRMLHAGWKAALPDSL